MFLRDNKIKLRYVSLVKIYFLCFWNTKYCLEADDLLHLMLYEQIICCHWSKNKENNKRKEIESRLKNNNYIYSRNQTLPESGINSFSPNTNSFLDWKFYFYILTSIQEGIRIWREGIYTRFWQGLIPRINIIIIF